MSASAAGIWARAGGVALIAVVLDQLSKAAVVASVRPGRSDSIFFGVDLTYVKNDGIAFGVLGGGGPLIIALVSLSVVLLLVYFARHLHDRWIWVPVGMILGGALGNVLDRVRLGYVVDFIDPLLWPAFNLADALIVLGVLGFALLVGGGKESPRAA